MNIHISTCTQSNINTESNIWYVNVVPIVHTLKYIIRHRIYKNIQEYTIHCKIVNIYTYIQYCTLSKHQRVYQLMKLTSQHVYTGLNVTHSGIEFEFVTIHWI